MRGWRARILAWTAVALLPLFALNTTVRCPECDDDGAQVTQVMATSHSPEDAHCFCCLLFADTALRPFPLSSSSPDPALSAANAPVRADERTPPTPPPRS
jgi:hypothetical protein